MNLHQYVSKLTDELNNNIIQQHQQMHEIHLELRRLADDTARLASLARYLSQPGGRSPRYQKRKKGSARQAKQSRKRNR